MNKRIITVILVLIFAAIVLPMAVFAGDTSIADSTVELGGLAVYSGSQIKPEPVVTLGGQKLDLDEDYTLDYGENINAGENAGKITITGIGSYSGTKEVEFTILRANLKSDAVVVEPIPDQNFTGSQIRPEPVITYYGNTLVENRDYILEYTDNTALGTATITVSGTGNFEEESIDVTFAIKDLTYKITFRPNTEDSVTCGGEDFTIKTITVTPGSNDYLAEVPALVRQDCVLMGWTDVAGGLSVKYTTEELGSLAVTGTDPVNIYAVWGVEVGLPVWVALNNDSDLPLSGRTYTFSISKLHETDNIPLPANRTMTLNAPTATGAANKVGYSAEDEDNPWRMQFTQGSYLYVVRQTGTAAGDETLDDGYWEFQVDIFPDDDTLYRITLAQYNGKVDSLEKSSFTVVKADNNVAATVNTENGTATVILGGNQVVKGDGFNTAVIKGNFAVDFTRDFKLIGSFTPPPSATPDGTCVGFMPNSAVPTSITGGGSLGYIGNSLFARAIVLDFDPYLNGSSYGDPDYMHFTLTETNSSGWPIYSTAQKQDVSDIWPDGECAYVIQNDASNKTLTFKVTLTNGKVLTYTYKDPVKEFGSSTAYFFMSGVVRYGPAYSYGLGKVGSTAPSLSMKFDSFYYLGQIDGFDEDAGMFVNSVNTVCELYNGSNLVSRWSSVQDAVKAAAASGYTARMVKDSEEQVTVPAGMELTLDLNGHTLSCTGTTDCTTLTNKGTLTLTDTSAGRDGKITATGNFTSANSLACCIDNEGTMTAIAGTISAGLSSNTGKAYGILQNGTMTVGGTLNAENSPANLYLPTGKTVTVGSDDLVPNGMSIGVTTETEPVVGSPVDAAVNYIQSYGVLFSDDTGEYYVFDEDGVVKIGLHDHVWKYTLSATNSENDTVTAECVGIIGVCDYEGNDLSLTIYAPTNLEFDRQEKKADLGTATTLCGKDLPTIVYEYKATEDGTYASASNLKNAGFYKASVTVGSGDGQKTAYVEYEVTPKTVNVTADNQISYVYSELKPLSYKADDLLDGDSWTGALSTNADKDTPNQYAILQGTLIPEDGNNGRNYTVVFTQGTYTVTPRLIQTLTFEDVTAGRVSVCSRDDPFTETVTGAETPVTYTSSDPSIASVDPVTGEVTLHRPGKVVITATAEASDIYESATASYTLFVYPLYHPDVFDDEGAGSFLEDTGDVDSRYGKTVETAQEDLNPNTGDESHTAVYAILSILSFAAFGATVLADKKLSGKKSR